MALSRESCNFQPLEMDSFCASSWEMVLLAASLSEAISICPQTQCLVTYWRKEGQPFLLLPYHLFFDFPCKLLRAKGVGPSAESHLGLHH